MTLFAQEPIENIILPQEGLETNTFSISGTLYDKKTKEPIIFGSVAIYNTDSKLITGAETDLDGKYYLKNIKPGTYFLEANYIGYETKRSEQILVIDEDKSGFDIFLEEGRGIICSFTTCGKFDKPLINMANPSYITTFTSSDISNRY